MSGVPMASQRRSLGVLAACADCVRTPPAPAATVLAYTPGDRAPSALQITGPRLGVSRAGAMYMVRVNYR